jgi:RimJ/RimL family protein N-acetyltransferase
MVGERVLRSFREEDVEPLREAFSDPSMALWNPGPTDGDVAAWCASANDTSDPTFLTWAVASAEGELLGTVSLFSIDTDQRNAELGFRVLPAARGAGVARWAARAAADHGFTVLELRRVQLFHGIGNVGSCRAAAAAGFRLEGTLRESYRYGDGRWHDEHLHARLAADD